MSQDRLYRRLSSRILENGVGYNDGRLSNFLPISIRNFDAAIDS